MDVLALPGARPAEVIRAQTAYHLTTIQRLGLKPD